MISSPSPLLVLCICKSPVIWLHSTILLILSFQAHRSLCFDLMEFCVKLKEKIRKYALSLSQFSRSIMSPKFNANDDIMMTSSNGNIFRVSGHLCGSPVNSSHKGQWRGALMFSLIYARINGWVNTDEAGDLRRHHANYDVIVMRNASIIEFLKAQNLFACLYLQ